MWSGDCPCFSAVSALQQDAQIFSALMYSSHTSMRDLYEVSLPELDVLVTIARSLPGCLHDGGGFGGCTGGLVEISQTRRLSRAGEAYYQQTQRQARVFICHASAGVESGAACGLRAFHRTAHKRVRHPAPTQVATIRAERGKLSQELAERDVRISSR
jgi:hypothetical protein